MTYVGVTVLGLVVAAASFGVDTRTPAAAAGNKACELLTAAEIEAVVGGKIDGLRGMNTAGGEMCTANARNIAGIVLSLTPKSGNPSTSPIKAAVEKLEKQGYQVDTQTFESVACVSATPPKNLINGTFLTSCFVDNATSVAGVQIIAKNQGTAVSVEKLSPLAEKMKGRF